MLQGIIKEEQVDTFNIPQYNPSSSEVKLEVINEGSFAINRLEVSEVNWSTLDDQSSFDLETKTPNKTGYLVARCMRAVAEPLLVRHFGDNVIEEVFSRYQEFLANNKISKDNSFINVTILLTRKA